MSAMLKRSRSSGLDSFNESHSSALQWVKVGVNNNVSGCCESGELFAFLSAPSPDNDALCSKMLRLVSGEDRSAMRGIKFPRGSESNSATGTASASFQMQQRGKETDIDAAIASVEGPGGIFLRGNMISKDTWQQRFSYIESSQALHLYLSLTVLETLCFSAELRLKKHTQPVELSALRLLTEMGFKDWAELRVMQLSEWQRRMLLFATEAIAGNDIMFFDLPTTDLDSSSALAMVTALQRAARGGRSVAISLTSLTFREYAILDTVQLVSSKGSLYLGAGANAANYFRQLDRTPSPGASITDFLLDLVDDDMWPGGYADAHLSYLESIAERRGLEQVVNSARRSTAGPKSSKVSSNHPIREGRMSLSAVLPTESIPVRAPRIALPEELRPFADSPNGYGAVPFEDNGDGVLMSDLGAASPPASQTLSASSYVQVKIVEAGSAVSDGAVFVYNSILSPGAAAAASGVGALLQTPLKTPTYEETQGRENAVEEHSLGVMLDSISEWTRNSEFLEEDVDECWTCASGATTTAMAPKQVVMQFSQCFWRAVVIRRRNPQQVLTTWAFFGLQVVLGFGILFWASDASDSVSFLRSRATFLVALPFSLVLLANNWNEYSEKDRNVLTYESLSTRAYFRFPVVSPVASLLADAIIFHLPPCIIASTVLYPIVGLSSGWQYFSTYLRTMVLMTITGCCLGKAIAGALALFSRVGAQEDMRPKANLVTSFVFSILFLYSGLLLETDDGLGIVHTCVRTCSFFYYGCNILLWNEFGHGGGSEVDPSPSTIDTPSTDSDLTSFLKSRHVSRQDKTQASLTLIAMIFVLISVVGLTQVARLKRISDGGLSRFGFQNW